jgi:dipeptidyl aminopeptidase/acylaminoacyl peptidase
MRKLGHAIVFALLILPAGSAAAQQNGGRQRLTIEQLIDIKHPSDPAWSPDGRRVAFVWDRAGVSNLYVANADGSGKPLAATSFASGQVGGAFWSANGETLYFPHDGDLWQVAAAGGEAQAVWPGTGHKVNITPSPDATRVAFVRPVEVLDDGSQQGSDLIVKSLSDGAETQIAHDGARINHVGWSPDGSHLAYAVGAIIHHDESPAYSGAKLVYRVVEYKPGLLFVVAASGGQAVTIGTAGSYDGATWIDGNHLVFARQSDQYKKRTIYVADASDGSVRGVHDDVEEKFWSIPDWGEANPDPEPSPDGKWIEFLTDQDGWDHIYVMPASGGDAVQVTKGHFEAWRPVWSHDSKQIAFDANQPDRPGDREVGIATIGDDPAHATIRYVTNGRGTNIAPAWSPDDKQLVYQHTDTRNSADFFVVAAAGGKPARLSDSMPAGMDRSLFVEPQFVHYPGPDGQQVPGWLFVPKNLDKTKKHPAIIWIHGDGVNQNYDGWHVQRNYAVYYSFHQYLLQEGYVVFAPDYRGSIGYGRDWRTGVYMDVGGKDAKDAWMAANYLKTLPYVDASRMGVWGLSYGGFFTLIAVTDQPTLFRAAVDVAGVVDYRMYDSDPYHGDWTESRIGTPEQNPQVYDQASPISHIDRLARPLLVLHGTADVNVPFLESVRLIDEALKKGKGNLLSFMVYPGEFHYFTREHVLEDAWHRVDRFFAQYLRPEGAAH